MPIYEYQCTSCHHQYDLMQKFSDEPATQCPQCFENSLVKLVSAAGFQLKGTGWYATDFKNKGNSAPASSDKKEGAPKATTDTTTEKATSTAAADTVKTSKGVE
jgi:putative FmdB family regulatory protein